jgi:hypothetical protein
MSVVHELVCSGVLALGKPALLLPCSKWALHDVWCVWLTLPSACWRQTHCTHMVLGLQGRASM